MTQAQSEEAKAVEAKLAENAPVKSDSVTFHGGAARRYPRK